MIQTITQAQALLEAKDAQAAVDALEGAAALAVDVPPADVDALWRLMPALGKALGAGWRKTVEKGGKKPLDHEIALKVAGELMDEGRFGLAQVLLRAAHQLRPRNPEVLGELVCCYEELGRNQDARNVLDAADASMMEQSFELGYLRAFNTLMTGDLPRTSQLLEALEDPGDPELEALASELDAMLERADAVDGVTPLDANDLLGWHWVINASVLLHLDRGDPRLKGRVARGEDGAPYWAAGVAGVLAAAKAWRMELPTVFHAPGAHHAALARAAAEALQRPCKELGPHGTLEPGLLVVHNVEDLPDTLVEALGWHHPGQLLWAHLSPWTREAPWAADVVTVLHHAVEPAPQQVVLPSGALPAPPAALLAVLEAVGTLRTAAGVGAFQTKGERRRQRMDSPVKADKA